MTPTVAVAPRLRAPAAFAPTYRFELIKLLAQWRIRIVLLACVLVPAGFVSVVSAQTSLPTDTVFGRWMHVSGWAGSLVVLAFACSWVLPLLTSLVAGDVFATEDRLGTWCHLLVAVGSPHRIFLGKALAALTVIATMLVALSLSSVLGGLAWVGGRPLVGLDGQSLAGGDASWAVLLAWLAVAAPTLAFAAIGLLGSVVLGRSPTGLLVPAVLALAMDLVLLLPVPVPLRVALPSNTFLAWRGLFTEPRHTGSLVVGIVVSLVWAAVATGLAHLLFTRRDFSGLAHDGGSPRSLAVAVLPLAVLVVLTALVVSAAPGSAPGVDRRRLETSLSTTYAHLYRLQTQQLHRPAVTEAELHAGAACHQSGPHALDRGPGNNWRCVLTWQLPGSTAQGSAVYQLDVAVDGRYVADGDGPKEVNGYFSVRTPFGDAPNPLWQFDGYVDLL